MLARNGWTLRAFASLAMSLIACVAAVAFTSSAVAATPGQSYGYTGDIGTPDTMDWGAAANNNPIAVSQDDGNVFLIRQFEMTFDIIDPAGTSITRPGVNVFPANIAVSPDGATVFVVDALGPTILKLTSDGAPTPTYTQDLLWTPGASLNLLGGMAVDPVSGDLVVAAAGGIYRFDAASGALLSSFDGSTSAGGAFLPRGIAIAPNQDIYAVAAPGRVEHMGADGSWKGSLPLPMPENSIVPWGVAVNPQTSDVAVEVPERADTVIKLFSSSNTLKDSIVVPTPVAADNTRQGTRGLAYAPDGSKLYIGTTNGSAHVFTFGTRPGLDAPVVSQVAGTQVHLSSDVATDGEASTARFEYCVPTDPCERFQTSDGSSPWHQLPPHTGLSNPTQDTIEDDLTGLAPNTSYRVRAYAINDTTKVEALTAAVSFRTALDPPNVTAGAASADDTSAQLSGTIDTFGDQTSYHFEYGLTTNYGSRVPANREAPAGSSRTPRTFTQTAKGLQPGTEYHYRLVATNAAGTTYGPDRTFTTLGVDQVAPHRSYEQVTSPNKNGLAIFNNWGFQVAENGSAIAFSAAAPAADAGSAAQASRYVSSRGQSDWSGQTALDPPLAPTRAIMFVVTHAVSEDFKHAFVVSQKALAPGAVEGAGNYYVTDVATGEYHLVGTTTQPGAFAQLAGPVSQNVFIAGADDFSWVVFISRYPLTPGAPQRAMYKWTRNGGLALISRLPNGSVPTGDTWFQSNSGTSNRLVSDDGTTWAFALSSGEGGVYLRHSDGSGVAVSVPQLASTPPNAPAEPGIADGISRDGNYVVFHSNSQLTDDATDAGPKLYRYDAGSGQLVYLGSLDASNDGSVDVMGIGGDGGTVYFHSNGELVVWREGQRDVVSPSTLRNGDYGYASPNGDYFVYLTGFDATTRDGVLHYYDAQAGEDVCMSCTVDGAVRVGGLPARERTLSNRLVQVVTDDGHAYFDTKSALLSVDHNGSRDVYEYYKGRLTLISPGDRDFTATLVGTSADTSSVFFSTSEGLVGQDTDQTYDVYVARVGGGFAGQNPPTPDAPCAKVECGEPGPGPVASPPVGSPPQPGTKSKRTNQEKVRLSVTRVAIGSKTMKITFHASQRGRVTISGARVVKAYKNVTKEGTYSVSVRLSRKAQSMQRAKKKFKLAVKVSLAGGWGTASVKYSRTLNK